MTCTGSKKEVRIPFDKEICLLLLRDHYHRIVSDVELLIKYAQMIGTTTLEKAIQDAIVSLNQVDVELEEIRREKAKGGRNVQ